jgi:hypothetical protein
MQKKYPDFFDVIKTEAQETPDGVYMWAKVKVAHGSYLHVKYYIAQVDPGNI